MNDLQKEIIAAGRAIRDNINGMENDLASFDQGGTEHIALYTEIELLKSFSKRLQDLFDAIK